MRIGGFLKLSLCDWPGHPAAVVFTQGCNYRCPWCHNPSLVYPECFGSQIPQGDVLKWISENKDMLDGVVVTGGEPTVQEDLPDFLKELKRIGMPVKLDTNGSNPEIVREALETGLVEWVAVDYKLPFRQYDIVTSEGSEAGLTVLKTARMVLDFEKGVVRTTIVPDIHTGEMLAEMQEDVGATIVTQPYVAPKSNLN